MMMGMKSKEQDKLIASFWEWFSEKEDLLLDTYANQTELIVEVLGRLKKIEPMLMCDFGLPVDEERREFVISAQGLKSVFPTVMKLVDAAPNLSCWVVRGFRPRRVEHMKVEYLEAVAETSNVFFTYSIKKGKMIVEIYYFGEVTIDERYEEIAGVMVQNLLGEYDTAMKIKIEKVGLVGEHKGDGELLPIVRLPRIFDEELEKD